MTEAFIQYLYYFHGPNDYFECHEVLEEHWKKEQKKQDIWVGFIQLAVSLYHMRRGNYKGAKKTIDRSSAIFKQHFSEIEQLGIDPEVLYKQTLSIKKQIQEKQSYQCFVLPFRDAGLQKEIENRCQEGGYTFGSPDCLNEQIIHKHRLRDRSHVIAARVDAFTKRHP